MSYLTVIVIIYYLHIRVIAVAHLYMEFVSTVANPICKWLRKATQKLVLLFSQYGIMTDPQNRLRV